METSNKSIADPKNNSILIFEELQPLNDYLSEQLGESHDVYQAYNLDMAHAFIEAHKPRLIVCNVDFHKNFWTMQKIYSHYGASFKFLFLVFDYDLKDPEIRVDRSLHDVIEDYSLKQKLEQRIQLFLKSPENTSINYMDFKHSRLVKIDLDDEQQAIQEKFLNTIQKNFQYPNLNPAFVSEKLGVEQKMLDKRVRAFSNQTTGEFIQNYRLNMASQLIKNGYQDITRIMMEVGFLSKARFTSLFREKFGITPEEFKNRNRAVRRKQLSVPQPSRMVPNDHHRVLSANKL